MGVLIDSSVLIGVERGRIHPARWTIPRPDVEFFLSVVTVSELIFGVHRARTAAVETRRAAFVEGVIERLPVLPIDLVIARTHARIHADLTARGALIGPHDLWLAATCLAHDLAIATGNRREFERVPGLAVEIWSEES